MPTILPIDTPSLGDRGYLVHDGRVAFVIDPQRDIDRVLDLAAAHGVTITHVFETHIHNDYVTGGYALARRVGAAYHVNADDPVSCGRQPVRDGDLIAVGEHLRVRVRHTPGHTFTHLAYILEADGAPAAVFTGGSLLYGSVGRPDLLGETAEQVAQAQRELVRIGVDRPAAHATGDAADWAGGDELAAYPRATFADLAQALRHRPLAVLDVRRNLERRESHVDGTTRRPGRRSSGPAMTAPALTDLPVRAGLTD